MWIISIDYSSHGYKYRLKTTSVYQHVLIKNVFLLSSTSALGQDIEENDGNQLEASETFQSNESCIEYLKQKLAAEEEHNKILIDEKRKLEEDLTTEKMQSTISLKKGTHTCKRNWQEKRESGRPQRQIYIQESIKWRQQ